MVTPLRSPGEHWKDLPGAIDKDGKAFLFAYTIRVDQTPSIRHQGSKSRQISLFGQFTEQIQHGPDNMHGCCVTSPGRDANRRPMPRVYGGGQETPSHCCTPSGNAARLVQETTVKADGYAFGES